MGLGVRSATPGTLVVLVATVLLIVVSVGVPITKSVYFLKANVSASVSSTTVSSGDIKLGVFGYCMGSTCSNVTVGYTLDVDTLFGVTGLAAEIGISNTLIKGLTYVLILHPIAAGFGLIATLCGLLAHIREFAITGFATCFASFGATFAFIAFGFDLALFIIAKKRIESSSVDGSADLGNGLWMTLAGALLLMFSGCFFGLGRCCIRQRQPGREASEKNKPVPDAAYGAALREDALTYKGGYGQAPMYQSNSMGGRLGNSMTHNGKGDGDLPEFAERDGEIIPLTALHAQFHHESDEEPDDPHHYHDEADTASLVTGVGQGYGRRADASVPVSLAPETTSVYSGTTAGGAGIGAGAAAAAGGAAAYLAAQAKAERGYSGSASTVAPFQGMHNPSTSPPTSPIRYTSPPSAPQPSYGAQPYASQPYGTQPYGDQLYRAPFMANQSGSTMYYNVPGSSSADAYGAAHHAQYSSSAAMPMGPSSYSAERGLAGTASTQPAGYPSSQPTPQQQALAQNLSLPSHLEAQSTGSTYPSYSAPSYYTHNPEEQLPAIPHTFGPQGLDSRDYGPHPPVASGGYHDGPLSEGSPGQQGLYNPYEHSQQRY